MLILTIRTDKPEAELGLYQDDTRLAYYTWQAHRQLAETIHLKIKEQLAAQHKELSDIQGIVYFKGPGSFTGLRIGASVANALADGLEAVVVGSDGEQWLQTGVKRLVNGQSDPLALPEYGAEANITLPRK